MIRHKPATAQSVLCYSCYSASRAVVCVGAKAAASMILGPYIHHRPPVTVVVQHTTFLYKTYRMGIKRDPRKKMTTGRNHGAMRTSPPRNEGSFMIRYVLRWRHHHRQQINTKNRSFGANSRDCCMRTFGTLCARWPVHTFCNRGHRANVLHAAAPAQHRPRGVASSLGRRSAHGRNALLWATGDAH